MDDREPPYLHGAMVLLEECHETVEALFTRFERAGDVRTKRAIVEAALYELKIHAAIEELIEPDAQRGSVQNLIAELESMTGDESRMTSASRLSASPIWSAP